MRERIGQLLQSRFSRDTIWLVAAQAVLMISGFGINFLIGKSQGADALGVFNQALAFYTILSTFFALGLNNTITKKVSEGQRSSAELQEILNTNLAITFLASSTLSALVVMIALKCPHVFSSDELARVVYIPMLALPFFNLNKNFGAYFTGMRMQKRFAIQRILRWVIIVAYVTFAVLTQKSAQFTLWCFITAELTVFLVNLILMWNRLFTRVRQSVVADNLKFGMKTYIAELISVLNSSMDVILIGYFLTNAETGVYSFIVYFVKTLHIFPGIMMQNFSPIISKSWVSGQMEELKKRMLSIRKLNSAVVTFQLLALVVMYPIITIYIKQEFNSTLWLFLLAACGAYVYALISWSGSMLIMTGKLNENIFRTLLIILLSATCTLVCSHFMKLYGACLAYSINGIIAFIATRTFIKKSLQISVI